MALRQKPSGMHPPHRPGHPFLSRGTAHTLAVRFAHFKAQPGLTCPNAPYSSFPRYRLDDMPLWRNW